MRQEGHGYGSLGSLDDAVYTKAHHSPGSEIYCAFMRKSITYIVKENISREPVVTRWAQLSDKILGQLRTMIDEMRRIPKPDARICNADGGSLWDCRLPTSLDRYGPFADTQELHSFLRNKLEKAPPHPEVDEMIELQKRDWGQPVFTHGDLSSLNILVRGDNVVGIVDWETAGWYPPYWEYTTASQVNIRDLWWADYIHKFLDPWTEAMAMEKTRQR